MTDRCHEFGFKPVHFHFMCNIPEDGHGSQEFLFPNDRRQGNQKHAAEFRDAITRESHTLKRTLTDPRILSGIGNAYSDEILHRARLSPVRMTRQLTEAESARLFEAAKATLADWIERLRREAGGAFPEGVTAFRPDMAVHGRYGRPCPDCGAPVQRIVHAENETNYCARCQTAGRLLADRALSRLLHQDWPRTLEEMEERRPGGAPPAPPRTRRRR
jgi:formamidopyrimidine-DNA glycosylase